MKRTPSKPLLLACVLIGFASVASAQTAVSAVVQPVGLSAADAGNDARNQPFCLQETGTRIHHRLHQTQATATSRPVACANSQPGRSFSRSDIDRTGEVNLADALRKLDPSIH
jgi:hypothetical protein